MLHHKSGCIAARSKLLLLFWVIKEALSVITCVVHDDIYLYLILYISLCLPLACPALPSAFPIRHSDRYRERLTKRDL